MSCDAYREIDIKNVVLRIVYNQLWLHDKSLFCSIVDTFGITSSWTSQVDNFEHSLNVTFHLLQHNTCLQQPTVVTTFQQQICID